MSRSCWWRRCWKSATGCRSGPRLGQKRAELASAAKSRLLANVAHEIKSPIGGVIGIGDLWSTGQLGPVTETQNEMAAMLVKTARQVEALSHDLLDVARAESGAVKVELRPTDVPGLLEDVRRDRRPCGPKRKPLSLQGRRPKATAWSPWPIPSVWPRSSTTSPPMP